VAGSPVWIRTVESLLATFDTCDRTAVSAGDPPTILFEHRRLVDFFSKRHVFLLQPLLGTLAIVDIGTGDIQRTIWPSVVAHRV